MRYRISNVRLELGGDIKFAVARALSIGIGDVREMKIVKKSVDARNKSDVHFVISAEIETDKRARGEIIAASEGIRAFAPGPDSAKRPIVVGLGPGGLFCALTLAEMGLRPRVFERGRPVDERRRDVSDFWDGGALNNESNVQFGEGGAGAFSDGKLTTGIKSEHISRVLSVMHECGAPEEILYSAKPHIGTDVLGTVVKNIRERIIALGGEIAYSHSLTGLNIEGGQVRGAVFNDCLECDTDAVALIIGHSARDTFKMLREAGVHMERKPFSIGARIEHPQRLINASQYGAFANHPALGAADYKLSARARDGRGVYTFCMCPGGSVIAAASEDGGTVVNGMSLNARDGANANSAVLVDVGIDDFPGEDALAGVEFARAWERRAYSIGGYRAPAQLVGDFLKNEKSAGPGGVEPSYKPGVTWANLSECLPAFAVNAMRFGIGEFDRRLRGFAAPDAVLTGVETRSSSPVRITRDENGEANVRGLYPAGEGAGYAGGITSAAVDGIRCALKIAGS